MRSCLRARPRVEWGAKAWGRDGWEEGNCVLAFGLGRGGEGRSGRTRPYKVFPWLAFLPLITIMSLPLSLRSWEAFDLDQLHRLILDYPSAGLTYDPVRKKYFPTSSLPLAGSSNATTSSAAISKSRLTSHRPQKRSRISTPPASGKGKEREQPRVLAGHDRLEALRRSTGRVGDRVKART